MNSLFVSSFYWWCSASCSWLVQCNANTCLVVIGQGIVYYVQDSKADKLNRKTQLHWRLGDRKHPQKPHQPQLKVPDAMLVESNKETNILVNWLQGVLKHYFLLFIHTTGLMPATRPVRAQIITKALLWPQKQHYSRERAIDRIRPCDH